MLEIRHLTKVYPNGFKALDDLSLTVGSNEFVVVIGLSGGVDSALVLAAACPARARAPSCAASTASSSPRADRCCWTASTSRPLRRRPCGDCGVTSA